MMIPAAHAENYRLVHSPTLKLEVFIDDVNNSKPESWCANIIPLRITSAQSKDALVLTHFLPRVGNLLEKQCPEVEQLPWILADKQGNKIASGNAAKNQKWKPVVKPPEATNSSGAPFAPAVGVASHLTSKDAIAAFVLPQGCQFRTHWSNSGNDSTAFVPTADAHHCDNNGLLNGRGTMIIQQEGVNQSHNVAFYQGYPLLNIDIDERPLRVVSANIQRLILGDDDNFLVLPFEPQLHAWVFQGEVIIEMPREQAIDQAEVDQKIAFVNNTWRPLITQRMPLTFHLVETLVVEHVDPTRDSYLSINDVIY